MLLQKTTSTTENSIFAPDVPSPAVRRLGAKLGAIAQPTGLIMTVWPSGDFHGGRRTIPRRDREPGPLDGIERTLGGIAYTNRPADPVPLSEGDRVELMYRLADLADAQCANGDDRWEKTLATALALPANAPNPVGLSAEFISTNRGKSPGRPSGRPVSRRGQNGITVRGKRMVRSACAILEADHGRGRLGFGTCTLPPLPKGDEMTVAANLSKVIKNFCRNMTRKLQSAGLSGNIVAVVEIQTHRYERWGTLGYHLHWVAHTATPGRSNQWVITPADHDDCWARALASVLGYRPNVRSACKIEKPRKSVKREVSKYMSKGNQICKQVAESDGAEFLPTAWYSISDDLKLEIKRRTRVFIGDSARWMAENLDQIREYKYIFFRHIYVDLPPNEPGGEPIRKWFGFAGHFLSNEAESILLDCLTNGNNLPVPTELQNVA